MTAIPPALTAALDQATAGINETVDRMIGEMTRQLTAGNDRDDCIKALVDALMILPFRNLDLATYLAFVVHRIAEQDAKK